MFWSSVKSCWHWKRHYVAHLKFPSWFFLKQRKSLDVHEEDETDSQEFFKLSASIVMGMCHSSTEVCQEFKESLKDREMIHEQLEFWIYTFKVWLLVLCWFDSSPFQQTYKVCCCASVSVVSWPFVSSFKLLFQGNNAESFLRGTKKTSVYHSRGGVCVYGKMTEVIVM